MTDEELVAQASVIAQATQGGQSVPHSTLSTLNAIALTRDQQQRHELARTAALNAGQLGDFALHVLRVVIFGLPI